MRANWADSLTGYRAVVVGASADLGVACALRLAEAGATVVVTDGSQAALDRATAAVSGRGLSVSTVLTAPGAGAGAAQLAAHLERYPDGLDVLAFCGGVVDWWPEADEQAPWWEHAVEANLLVPVLYTEALEPFLVRSGRASVVYYGTIDGIRGNPRMPAYSVSRAGLVPWTHIVAHRLGPSGGRANYIAGATLSLNGPDVPSGLRTVGWDVNDAMRQTPLRRSADPAEAADVIAFLAGPGSSYISGSVLTMDGGRTAITPGTGLCLFVQLIGMSGIGMRRARSSCRVLTLDHPSNQVVHNY
jgi:NAD(P)-dependent dehydrogenase (short-subunit alcohol dehydrogenase family)